MKSGLKLTYICTILMYKKCAKIAALFSP